MEVNFKPEKFINADPPELTDGMIDWFYSNLWSWQRNRYEFCDIKKIDTINVRLNTSYNGWTIIYFYISINGGPEFCAEFDKTYYSDFHDRWKKNYGRAFNRDKELCTLINVNGVDIGDNGPVEREERRIELAELKRNAKQHVKRLRSTWESYVRLKAYFNID